MTLWTILSLLTQLRTKCMLPMVKLCPCFYIEIRRKIAINLDIKMETDHMLKVYLHFYPLRGFK